MRALFVVGLVYAVAFRLTGSVLILWPVFQPMGHLYTLIQDRLALPLEATVAESHPLGLARTTPAGMVAAVHCGDTE